MFPYGNINSISILKEFRRSAVQRRCHSLINGREFERDLHLKRVSTVVSTRMGEDKGAFQIYLNG